MRNSTHLVFPVMLSSEEYGTSLVLVVVLLSILLALLSVSTILFILGLVVYVLLPRPTLLLLFALFLLTACNSNFIGYNCLYGTSHCKSYACIHIAIGNLVR